MSWPVGARVVYTSGTSSTGTHSEWDSVAQKVVGISNVRIPSGTLGTVTQWHGPTSSVITWDHDERPCCVAEIYMRLTALCDLSVPEEVEAWLTR